MKIKCLGLWGAALPVVCQLANHANYIWRMTFSAICARCSNAGSLGRHHWAREYQLQRYQYTDGGWPTCIEPLDHIGWHPGVLSVLAAPLDCGRRKQHHEEAAAAASACCHLCFCPCVAAAVAAATAHHAAAATTSCSSQRQPALQPAEATAARRPACWRMAYRSRHALLLRPTAFRRHSSQRPGGWGSSSSHLSSSTATVSAAAACTAAVSLSPAVAAVPQVTLRLWTYAHSSGAPSWSFA